MTEQQYRELSRLSYSALKVFADDRIKYKRMYEQGRFNESGGDTKSTIFGNLTDTLLLEPETFEERFAIAKTTKPSGQMGEFVDILFQLTEECTNEAGIVTLDMKTLLEEAYNQVAYDDEGVQVKFLKKSFAKVVTEFSSKGGIRYYDEMRSNTGRFLISMKEYKKAESLVDTLKTHRVTRTLMNLVTGGDYEVRNQEVILYDKHGHECKSMLDKLFINHKRKIIQPFDLKTTYFVEGFLFNYLKYRYYIQAGLYHYAVEELAKKEGISDYEILPMKFIAADSNCYYDPLVYSLNLGNLRNALDGFWVGEKEYVGVDRLMKDLHWHKEKNIWTSSKDNYENEGVCSIKVF